MARHPHVANYEGNSGQLSCFGQQCCLILPFLYCYIVFPLPYHNCEEVEEANTGRVCLDRSGRASSRGSSSREGSEGSAGALGNQGGVIHIFINIARGTTDPEIDSETWTKLGNNNNLH